MDEVQEAVTPRVIYDLQHSSVSIGISLILHRKYEAIQSLQFKISTL
jgi:hypothetical protein